MMFEPTYVHNAESTSNIGRLTHNEKLLRLDVKCDSIQFSSSHLY
jgi:hypothetical protein